MHAAAGEAPAADDNGEAGESGDGGVAEAPDGGDGGGGDTGSATGGDTGGGDAGGDGGAEGHTLYARQSQYQVRAPDPARYPMAATYADVRRCAPVDGGPYHGAFTPALTAYLETASQTAFAFKARVVRTDRHEPVGADGGAGAAPVRHLPTHRRDLH